MDGSWNQRDAQPGPGTLCEALDTASALHDVGYTFIDDDGEVERMSYAQLAQRAHRRAGALRGLGLNDGDRVALVLEDNRQFVVSFFAALLAKLVPVPMYPPTALGKLDAYLDTAAGIARVAGSAAMVTGERLRTLLWPVAGKVASVRRVVTPEMLDAAPAELVRPAVAPDDLAFLQFTSGSTSAPKGVAVTHRCLVANTRAILRELIAGPSPTEYALSWLPLYHDMGLIGFVIAPLYCQRPVVLMSPVRFLQRPERWFQALHEHGATVTFAPNFAYALAVKRVKPVDIAKLDLSRVRVFGCGAEPIRAATLRAFVDHFAPAGVRATALLPCYGMAEATLAISHHPVGAALRVERVDLDLLRTQQRGAPAGPGAPAVEIVSCGRVLGGHEVRIVDRDRRELPPREVGEIEVRGPSIAAGYFQDEPATRATFCDGWLRTGDLGFIVDGDLFVTGRTKDLIIVAGRNHGPEQIEAAAAQVDGVRPGNVVAFGVPGRRGTDDVVVVCESAAADRVRLAEAVRAHVATEIGLRIAEVAVLAPGTLPKTSSGKLQRSKTRELFLDGSLR
ncbi:MAG TPA: fatty acyl-AMP ligase, partial [Kofleriaceae bacterium]|nr:fatty acyl-AMP ligase [Kofleriaceae bacterium]